MNSIDLTILWQILGYGGLLALAVVLIFAIIEPGPLAKQKGFGSSKKKQGSTEDESDLELVEQPGEEHSR